MSRKQVIHRKPGTEDTALDLVSQARSQRGGKPLRPLQASNVEPDPEPDPKDERLLRIEDYLLARGKSEDTIEKYLRVSTRLIKYSSKGDKDPFTRDGVIRYIAELRRKKYQGNTLRWHYYVIRTCFRGLSIPWEFEPGEAPKASKRNITVIRDQAMRKMEKVCIKKIEDKENSFIWLRNRVIIRLDNVLGIRRGEIRNLNIEDFDGASMKVQTLKGGNDVRRRLDVKTCELLDKYIKRLRRYRSRPDKEALFIRGQRGSRLSNRGLNYIHKIIREEAGIKGHAGFHSVRRGRVTSLHKGKDGQQMSGQEITKLFGWSSNKTVDGYINLTQDDVDEKMEEIHPYFNETEDGAYSRVDAVIEEIESESGQDVEETPDEVMPPSTDS